MSPVVMEFDSGKDSVLQGKNWIVMEKLQKKSLVICPNVIFGVNGELGVTVLPVVEVESSKDQGIVETDVIVSDLQKKRRAVLMSTVLIGVPGAAGMNVLLAADKDCRKE